MTRGTRRLRPRGLRSRLTIWIGAILVLAVGASFVAIYRGTGQQLRGQLDRELRTQAGSFAVPLEPVGQYAGGHPPLRDPPALQGHLAAPVRQAAERLHSDQRTRAARAGGSRRPRAREPATQAIEQRQARAIRAAPDGYSTVTTRDVGEIRLYVRPSSAAACAWPRSASASRSSRSRRPQHGVARDVPPGRPVRPGCRGAGRVRRGLPRVESAAPDGGHRSRGRTPARSRTASTATTCDGEIRVLADSFDNMLDRLDDAFARQRAFVVRRLARAAHAAHGGARAARGAGAPARGVGRGRAARHAARERRDRAHGAPRGRPAAAGQDRGGPAARAPRRGAAPVRRRAVRRPQPERRAPLRARAGERRDARTSTRTASPR